MANLALDRSTLPRYKVLMQTQRRLQSSSAAQIYREIKRAVQYERTTIDDELRKWKLDPPMVLAVRELFDKDERPAVLVQLANLHDTGYRHFLKSYPVDGSRFYALTEDQLLALRDELRFVWRSTADSITPHQYLIYWLKAYTPL